MLRSEDTLYQFYQRLPPLSFGWVGGHQRQVAGLYQGRNLIPWDSLECHRRLLSSVVILCGASLDNLTRLGIQKTSKKSALYLQNKIFCLNHRSKPAYCQNSTNPYSTVNGCSALTDWETHNPSLHVFCNVFFSVYFVIWAFLYLPFFIRDVPGWLSQCRFSKRRTTQTTKDLKKVGLYIKVRKYDGVNDFHWCREGERYFLDDWAKSVLI